MINWTRKELKDRAKNGLRIYYGPAFAVSLLSMFLAGSSGAAGSGGTVVTFSQMQPELADMGPESSRNRDVSDGIFYHVSDYICHYHRDPDLYWKRYFRRKLQVLYGEQSESAFSRRKPSLLGIYLRPLHE